jgi:predicted lipoprotein with Yx(FWY)xxD motif
MLRTRSALLCALSLLGALALAACGSTSSNAGSSSSSPATSSSSSTTSTTASTLPIKTAAVSVAGSMKTVLVTAQGLTLYYHTPDTASSVFVGSSWPPLLASSGAPTSTVSLPGTLSVMNDANGAQVTYNGHPLYTFAGDSGPGQATGDGLGGVWFVATPDLAKVSLTGSTNPSPKASPTPCIGYYCR